MRLRTVIRAGFSAILLLSATACDFEDPYTRAGLWRPRGANDGNLAAQIADPSDLVRGKEDATSDGVLAAAAVDRLHTGKVKDLGTGSLDATPAAAQASGGGGGAGDTQGAN